MSAYDESYLDGMLMKTRYLFKLIGRNSLDPLYEERLQKIYGYGESDISK